MYRKNKKNKARNRLKKNISRENIEEYKKRKAIAQKTLRRAKYSFGEQVFSNLNRMTSLSQLWSTVRQLNGVVSNSAKTIPSLCIDGNNYETNEEKANIFADFFQAVGEPSISSSDLSLIQDELDMALAENDNYSHLTINELFTSEN